MVGVERMLEDLARLAWVMTGGPQEAKELSVLQVPQLERVSLFNGGPQELDDDDDLDEVVRDRVDMVGRHMRLLSRSIVDTFDEAHAAARLGDLRRSAHSGAHAEVSAAALPHAFDLWCEVLHGHFNATGRYPGTAGDQVASFTTWLAGNRGDQGLSR